MSTGSFGGLPVDTRKAFVAEIASKHGTRLRRYLAARLRSATDVADLAQEVFLRLLRVDRHDKIRSPESYLFTIASHVLHQHRLNRAGEFEPADIMDPLIEQHLAMDADPAKQIEQQGEVKAIEGLLAQLPPVVHACVILHCRDGWTLEEIGTKLGVSRSMVKKHLAKAVLHCRQNLQQP